MWRERNVVADDLQDINVWVELAVIVLIILTLPVIRPRTGDDSYQFLPMTLTHFPLRDQNKTPQQHHDINLIILLVSQLD